MKPIRKPIRKPTPWAFAVVWNAFTIVHAGFMLSGVQNASLGIRLALLAFYALFLAIGVGLVRSALRWRRFVQAFGTPSIGAMPALRDGEPVTLSLRFDRAWPPEESMVGTLAWTTADDEGDVDRTFDASALPLSVQRLGDATLVHATGMPPAPSAAALAAHPVLELHLHAHDDARRGWRWRLTDVPGHIAFGARAAAVRT